MIAKLKNLDIWSKTSFLIQNSGYLGVIFMMAAVLSAVGVLYGKKQKVAKWSFWGFARGLVELS